MSERLSFGYLVSALIVVALIAVLAIAWRLGLHPVLAFWVIYILTRPLGASLGDLLAQPPDQGGLGLGTTVTSVAFLAAILAMVVYLSVSSADVIPTGHQYDHDPATIPTDRRPGRAGLVQTIVVVAVLLVAGAGGYTWRTAALQDTAPAVAADAPDPAATGSPPGARAAGSGTPGPGTPGPRAAAGPNARLGDLSEFRTITGDTIDRLTRGDQSGATTRVTDLETAWDQAQGRLQARDKTAWTRLDGRIDTVLTDLRADTPDPATEKTALAALLTDLR